MRILHYALGFPPFRTGGLTKYCTDLMLTQIEQGHYVGLCWPGQIGLIDKRIRIRKTKDWKGILSFEIVNPLPVALDEGILDIEAYIKTVDSKPYFEFLKELSPDAIHIHTLMGLHQEFIDAAKQLGIRLVFTSHDYYGLCPKVTLFHDGKPCDDDHHCEDCIRCNLSALSIKKITLLQSPFYRILKNTSVVKRMRQRHRREFFEQEESEINIDKDEVNIRSKQYHRLRDYYISMLRKIDKIHFNSSVAEKVYKRYFTPKSSQIIPITHRDIKDNRRIKDFNHEKLRLTYLGPAKAFKGYYLLLDALDQLWADGIKGFELRLYTSTNVEKPYITYQQDGYPYSQLEAIFDNTDLLVAPSLCYETFGFTVLEALSYGVPVLVSGNVGAGDFVNDMYGAVFNTDLKDIEKKILNVFEENRLSTSNKWICSEFSIPDFFDQTDSIY